MINLILVTTLRPLLMVGKNGTTQVGIPGHFYKFSRYTRQKPPPNSPHAGHLIDRGKLVPPAGRKGGRCTGLYLLL